MSISGKASMALMRMVKPGKGSFSDLGKLREKARRENEGFTFSYPRSGKAHYRLAEGTPRECLIIDPVKRRNSGKAILYIYGGVTNNWKTQRRMAVGLAADSGTQVWYPVYPSMSESPAAGTVEYITGIYRRMTEHYDPSKIIINGVSMGGMFALQLVNALNTICRDLPMPGLIVAHSPAGWPVREEDWDLFRKYEASDPMFSEGDIRMTLRLVPEGDNDRYLCPELGDFRNAPPTYLYYGEEMIAGSAPLYERAFERCDSSGNLHVTITKNMMHSYSCMPVFPESRKSYNEILRLIDNL